MVKLNQKGVIQIAVVLILLAGIGATAYLVNRPEVFKLFSKAQSSTLGPAPEAPYPCDRPDQLKIGAPVGIDTTGDYKGSSGCPLTAYARYIYTTDADGDGVADPKNQYDQPWCDNNFATPENCASTPAPSVTPSQQERPPSGLDPSRGGVLAGGGRIEISSHVFYVQGGRHFADLSVGMRILGIHGDRHTLSVSGLPPGVTTDFFVDNYCDWEPCDRSLTFHNLSTIPVGTYTVTLTVITCGSACTSHSSFPQTTTEVPITLHVEPDTSDQAGGDNDCVNACGGQSVLGRTGEPVFISLVPGIPSSSYLILAGAICSPSDSGFTHDSVSPQGKVTYSRNPAGDFYCRQAVSRFPEAPYCLCGTYEGRGGQSDIRLAEGSMPSLGTREQEDYVKGPVLGRPQMAGLSPPQVTSLTITSNPSPAMAGVETTFTISAGIGNIRTDGVYDIQCRPRGPFLPGGGIENFGCSSEGTGCTSTNTFRVGVYYIIQCDIGFRRFGAYGLPDDFGATSAVVELNVGDLNMPVVNPPEACVNACKGQEISGQEPPKAQCITTNKEFTVPNVREGQRGSNYNYSYAGSLEADKACREFKEERYHGSWPYCACRTLGKAQGAKGGLFGEFFGGLFGRRRATPSPTSTPTSRPTPTLTPTPTPTPTLTPGIGQEQCLIPTNLRCTHQNPDRLEVSWDKVDGADRYRTDWSPADNSPGYTYNTGTNTSAIGVSDKEHTASVKAICGNQESSPATIQCPATSFIDKSIDQGRRSLQNILNNLNKK